MQNEARSAAGIRTIKETWTQLRSRADAEVWADDRGEPCKVVQKTPGGALEWEEDYYLSGRHFTNHDGTFPEMLTIHYKHTDRSVAVFYHGPDSSINIMVRPFQKYHDAPTNAVNAFKTADAVLAKWGIPRL